MIAPQVEQTLLRQWRSLKPEQQRATLDFVEYLHSKTPTKQPRRSLLGLCAVPYVRISAEEIAEARREMWEDFPRDIEPQHSES